MLDLVKQLQTKQTSPPEAFIKAFRCLESKTVLPEEIRVWLVDGFANYATGNSNTLESALGLQVETGRYSERVQYLWKQAKRDHLLHRLVESLPSKKTGSIRLISAALSDVRASEDWPPKSRQIFQQLLNEHPNCPKSTRQLERILNKQTTAQKYTDIKSPGYVVPQ